jgi:pyruvate/2-oxoglutarate dehydrogenase complex dihydrolipoamide dehydrogenase (E3) component
VHVTLIEAGPRLVGRADADVSAGLAGSFRDRGISVRTETLVERLERTPTGMTVHYRFDTEQRALDAQVVFFAGAGRRCRRDRNGAGLRPGRR